MNNLMELITSSPIDKTTYSFLDENAILELRELGLETASNEIYKDLIRRQKHVRIAAHNYSVITDKAIQDFLERKVAIYNSSKKKKVKYPARNENNKVLLSQNEFDAIMDDVRIMNGRYVNETYKSLSYPMHPIPNFPVQYYYPNIFFSKSLEDQRRVIFRKPTKDSRKSTGIGEYVYEEVELKNYPGIPPRHVLETLKEHKARNLFDYFTIGSVKEIPDPILFGRIEEDKERRWFIAQWGNDACLDDLI